MWDVNPLFFVSKAIAQAATNLSTLPSVQNYMFSAKGVNLHQNKCFVMSSALFSIRYHSTFTIFLCSWMQIRFLCKRMNWYWGKGIYRRLNETCSSGTETDHFSTFYWQNDYTEKRDFCFISNGDSNRSSNNNDNNNIILNISLDFVFFFS